MSRLGHPLPGSDEARHNEVPEHLEREKGEGDDPRPVIQPDGDPVRPDGKPYRYDDAQVSRAPHGSALSGGQGDLSIGRGPGTKGGIEREE